MPRNPIDISDRIDSLSILSPDGEVDADLDPDIPEDLLKELYKTMVLAREFDTRQLNLQRQGRIGTFPPITGQEAASLGAAAVLKPSDWLVPAFRETPAEIWRGRTLESILYANNGFNEGGAVPEDCNNLPVSIPVGSQAVHAVGIAWGMKYRGREDLAMTFFGDGATSEGDVHEALNFAGVFGLPVIFVCQNNQWAISIPRSRQTHSKTIAQKALAYGIAGIQVDGNDILAVYAAAKEAAERARAGDGATLIECVTYRMMMHTTADDPKRYRTEEEVESWREKDPIKRFRVYLEKKGVFSEKDFDAITDDVKTQIQEAVDRAEKEMGSMGDPLEMFDHAYAEMPPHLTAQREQLREAIAAEKEDDHG